MEKPIRYYETRLKFIRELFKGHMQDLLQENADKIKMLVDGYNRFKNHPDYDSTLSEFPKVLIFN